MADIFVTEESTGEAEENSETDTEPPQVQVVIEEAEEPQQLLNDSSESVKEPENSSDMTLKQGEPEPDQFGLDGLLVNPDDLLPPVDKLEKYADSDIAFNRQVVVRNLLETLRVVQGNQDNVARVINVMCSLSEDYDPVVRSELMGQFPHIATFCKEAGLDSTIHQYLWPILISYLGAENNQVRKASHTTLLSIVKDKQIESEIVTEKICPLVVHLTDSIHSEDLRNDAILLMSKLAVLLGNKVTEDLFFQRIFALCVDKTNSVRKAVASTFGEICTTVGAETTEETLLPKYIELCKDSIWCVRKACAENFMTVSSVVSREMRCRELSEIYMVLLKDQSKWVRVTAYQNLGPFIFTFAEPYKTGLYYNDGILTIFDIYQEDENSSQSQKDKIRNEQSGDTNCESAEKPITSDVERTSTSESCDSIVPLSCPEKSLSASEIPGIPCHVGNYCTVIEVSCPSTTAVTASADSTVNAISNPPAVENGPQVVSSKAVKWCERNDAMELPPENMHYSPQVVSSKEVKWCERNDAMELPPENMHYSTAFGNIKYLCTSEVGENTESLYQLWYQFLYGTEDSAPIVNGDVSRIAKDLKENSSDSEKIQTSVKSPVDSNLLNSITINGIHLNPSEMLSRPLSCQTIPVVNCVNQNSIHFDKCLKVPWKKLPDVICESGENVKSNGPGAIADSGSTPSANAVEQNNGDKGCSLDESAFNHFQYWRVPVPEIDICSTFNELCSLQSSPEKASSHDLSTNSYHSNDEMLLGNEMSKLTNKLKHGEYDGTSENKEGEPPPGPNEVSVDDQDIVPADLLRCYLAMIDTTWTEIAHHCAYSLPAVAITLGRNFWPCLRETFNALSSDLQVLKECVEIPYFLFCDKSGNDDEGFIMMWKVRRTVASSMHQLAVILGPDITSKDLLPVFSRFINDLDEVRIGILQHISEFLKELRPPERKEFLPRLSEFLVSNSNSESNEKNWRFRLILAEQLVSVADLFEPQDVKEHLVPLSLTLIQDKICEVRLAAVRVMAAVMRRMSQHPTPDYTKAVLSELTEKFIHSPKWIHRQLYVYVCQEFIKEISLPPDQFAEDALPQLLYLCWDRVPNVRIAIARCLAVIMWPLETFSGPESPHRELLLQTIHTLQSDLDADVQFYANMVSTHECSCLQHGEFTNLSSIDWVWDVKELSELAT